MGKIKLPAKDEMRAQLLGLFEAPMSQTLSTMESLLTSVMHCLENKKDKDLNSLRSMKEYKDLFK